MSAKDKIKHELKAVLLLTLYFGCWIAALLTIKSLVLAEYQIAFHEFSLALGGALVLSKVVHVLGHVSLGAWVRSQPAWVDVVLRTILYCVGVLIVLVIEKGIEGRKEHGDFAGAVAAAFRSTDAAHVWANLIGVSGALLVYNATSVVNAHLGSNGLWKLFLRPVPPSSQSLRTPAAGRA